MSERAMLLADDPPKGAGRRRLRRAALWIGSAIGILCLGAWLFGPDLLELPVRNRLLAMTEAATGGTAVVDRVDLSWSGPQIINGLRTSGVECRIDLDLSMEVTSALWALVGPRVDPLPVSCSGSVKLKQQPLPAAGEMPIVSGVEPAGGFGDVSFGDVPSFRLELGPLDVELVELSGERRHLVTDDLVLAFNQADSSFQAVGGIEQAYGGVDGQARIELAVQSLLDSSGRLQVSSVVGALRLEVIEPAIAFHQLKDLHSLNIAAERRGEGGSARMDIDGSFAFSSTEVHHFALAMEHAAAVAATPGRIQAVADSFPMQVVDRLAGMAGELETLLGPTVDVVMTRTGQLDVAEAVWQVAATTPVSSCAVTMQSDGVDFWMQPGQVFDGRLRLSPESLAEIAWNLGPVLDELHTVDDPIDLHVESLSLNRGDPVSSLNADLSIDIGPVTLDSRSPVFSVLEHVLSSARRYVPAVIDPVEIKIRNGVVTYDSLEIHFRRASIRMAGLVDLNDGRIDMVMEIPLDAIGSSVNELRDFSQLIGGVVEITGTLEHPIIQFVPEFRPEGLLRIPGLDGILESIGDESTQPLFDGIDGLFRPGRD